MAPHQGPWTAYPVQPSLAPGDVHVARLAVAAGADFLSRLEGVLAGEEVDRAAAFHFDADRVRYVVARGGLRVLLAAHLDVSPEELRFRTNRYGKPLLWQSSGADGLRFNVSHSGPLVLYAFARDRRVGVDVELIREDLPHRDIADRYFSPTEREALRRQSPADRAQHFFAVWTRKEAYMKGRGQGMSIPSQEFTVVVDDGAPVDDRNCISRPGGWRTSGVPVGNGCAGAVAAQGRELHIALFEAFSTLEARFVG